MYAASYSDHPSSDTVPQLDYITLFDTEEAFTTFANACAQAGSIKCFLVRMIQGNATGSDVRTLITSTIDVSLSTPMRALYEVEFRPIARLEAAEGWIHRTPSTNWGTQGYAAHFPPSVPLRKELTHVRSLPRVAFRLPLLPYRLANNCEPTAISRTRRDPDSRSCSQFHRSIHPPGEPCRATPRNLFGSSWKLFC